MLRWVAGKRPPRIGRTLLVNLGMIGVAMALLLSFLLNSLITRSFTALEDREIAAHLARIEDYNRSNLEAIGARSKDWGIWDDTYRYVGDFNATYQTANVNAASFVNAMVDGMAIVRSSDGDMRSFAFDSATGRPAPAFAEELAGLVRRSDLPALMARTGSVQGFVELQGRIYVLGAVNVLRSDGSGAAPGYLVFVQELNQRQVSSSLQVPTVLSPHARGGGLSISRQTDKVAITVPLADPAGAVIGSIDVVVPRPLLGAARELLVVAVTGAILAVLALLGVLHWRLRQLVLGPVGTLHAHIQQIRETGELALLDAPRRKDELGAVQDELNAMATELQDLRARVESQSFALGKSQSAVGLMHNLRNCLSPVRVILDNLERDVATAMPAQVSRALDELAAPETEQTRRERLVQFVSAAHDGIAGRDAGSRYAVREAARNLMNAFAAIDAVQHDNGDASFDERCDLAVMLSHAANIVRFSGGEQVDVRIHADPGAVASGNRVLLRQVIENLVANALEAVRESGRSPGAVVLAAATDPHAGQCRITVTDNGAGFGEATATRLFERGFSTRESRSGGLGLHWCANTVQAMGGTLSLHSAGTGKGARATIVLTARPGEGNTIADAA